MFRMKVSSMAVILLAATGCADAPGPDPKPAPAAPAPAGPPVAATTVAARSSTDAPEISRSAGTPGGIVVLWPRVLADPTTLSDSRQIAARIQRRLSSIAARA